MRCPSCFGEMGYEYLGGIMLWVCPHCGRLEFTEYETDATTASNRTVYIRTENVSA